MSRSWVKTINNYFEEVLYRGMKFRGFCNGFEQWWNFDFKSEWEIEESEKEILQKLFDIVVLYSEEPVELNEIQMYKSEDEIRKIVKDAYKLLGGTSAA